MALNMLHRHNSCQAYSRRAVHCPTSGIHAIGMDRNKLFGMAIKQFRKAAGGMTQNQLADRIAELFPDYEGLDQPSISKIERGQHGAPDMHVDALARGLGVRASEIMQAIEVAEDGVGSDVYVPPTQPGIFTVPLIGLVQAGTWDQVDNPFDPAVSDGYVTTTERVSHRAYAFEVKGESMTNPKGWPTFPPGTRVIVEPNKQADSGSLVVASLRDDDEATFKKLVRDGGITYLVPLNPQYPTITVDRPIRICGVVVTVAERKINN